jgi:simple sugar transport system permease protein
MDKDEKMTSQINAENSATPLVYKETFSLGRFARANGTQLGMLGVFLLLWIIFIAAAPNTFTIVADLLRVHVHHSLFAIIAIPLTLVVIAKEIDLSFPSVMAMGMVSFSFVYNSTAIIDNANIRVLFAIIAALLTGTFIGWLNGVIVVRFGIPSLVATIGTQFFWRGAVLVLTQGANFTLSYVKGTFLYPLLVGKIGGYMPMQMVWLIVFAVLGWVLLNRHKFGAHIYLIGDNKQSAELMGVNTGRVRIRVFMLG